MKRIIFLMMLILMGPAPLAEAGPPVNIELSYDSEAQLLTVVVSHLTNNTRDHRIRKFGLFKNEEHVSDYYFPRQTSPSGLDEQVALGAAPGDVIKVMVVCNEHGSREASLVVPEPEEESQEK